MGGYFKPLRRKFGVVALMIACACMGWWMRKTLMIAQLPNAATIEYVYQLHESRFALFLAVNFTVLAAVGLFSKPRASGAR